jgi:hypothetical protein
MHWVNECQEWADVELGEEASRRGVCTGRMNANQQVNRARPEAPSPETWARTGGAAGPLGWGKREAHR